MPLGESKFLVSQRNQPHLSYNGYRYRRNGPGSAISQSWRCCEAKCKGKASTPKPFADGCRVVTSGRHCHTNDPAKEELGQVRQKIKERANEGTAPRRLISEETIGLSQEARGRLKPNNLKRTIQRQRVADGGLPTEPALSRGLDIPERFKQTKDGQRFLLFDSHGDDDEEDDAEDENSTPRIIIFSSQKQLEILERASYVHYDGTFKVSPNLFYQLFCLHAIRNGNLLPCVFGLLMNKTQETYTQFFQAVKNHIPQWRPLYAMGDFEIASHRAFSSVFPEANITGCLFHLGQSVYRNAIERHLQTEYERNENVRKYIKYLVALAFVPITEIRTCFDDILASTDFPADENVEDLYDYFETWYVGKVVRNRLRNPRFSLTSWNMVDRIRTDQARTNNLVESWHRGIQASLDCEHPSVWKCIKFLQLEEAWTITKDEMINTGQLIRKERKEQKEKTERLKTLVERFSETPLLDFLRGVSYNIALNV